MKNGKETRDVRERPNTGKRMNAGECKIGDIVTFLDGDNCLRSGKVIAVEKWTVTDDFITVRTGDQVLIVASWMVTSQYRDDTPKQEAQRKDYD
jgi:hypothetical protein